MNEYDITYHVRRACTENRAVSAENSAAVINLMRNAYFMQPDADFIYREIKDGVFNVYA